MMSSLSLLQTYRLKYKPTLPSALESFSSLIPKVDNERNTIKQNEKLKTLFPHTCDQPILHFQEGNVIARPLRVGVVLSGGQAPGGHNVIAGLYDALKKIHSDSSLIGFLDGPNGIVKNKTKEIDEKLINLYRNQGGFDLIGSGRTKIETPDQFSAAESTVKQLALDGLVIIGGDDSNTNAALLAEYFKQKGIKTSVVGVPKTIDGDLKNEFIEISFGFDTACKIYSEIIGNILKDALSSKKYYFFIKLMGRSASHIALECALKTHPNLTLISEEIAEKKLSLEQLVIQMVDLICSRSEQNKDYGVILIPEGVIEFIPEFKQMIQELNSLLVSGGPHAAILENLESFQAKQDYLSKCLSAEASHCFKNIPEQIAEQLLLDRDPHGNVQVSKIETERLFVSLVERELKKRKQQGTYKGKFAAQPLFCGYEGRSGLPSNFDCQYCYALGYVAALLVRSEVTGYMSCINNLTKPVTEWTLAGVPIFQMLHLEVRGDKTKPVIRKALVDLTGKAFQLFSSQRDRWMFKDNYSCPGPIQFEGPSEIVDSCPIH